MASIRKEVSIEVSAEQLGAALRDVEAFPGHPGLPS